MQNVQNVSSDLIRELTCWVPNCSSNSSSQQKLFSLPDNPKSREIWLALAGKPVTSSDEPICFCSQHFSPTEILKIDKSYFINCLPLKQMPEKICRLCLTIIESTDSAGDSIYILSKFIPTEMPSCIEDILNYFEPCNPEPLLKMVSFCISGLDIECNPPPLLCESCFINVWLFYVFKTSAIEVEKTLKDSLPLENYSKMVLCRSCPVRFGTNFFVVAEDTPKGNLLKTIFKGDSTQKDPLPLRICKNCFDVITRLESFHRDCEFAEKKMKLHIKFERNIAQRRSTSNESKKLIHNQNQEISTLFRGAAICPSDSQTSPSTSEVLTMDMSNCYTVRTNEKLSNISIAQWAKETLAKIVNKHGRNLRTETDFTKKTKIWSTIQDEMAGCGTNFQVAELSVIWSDLIKNARLKCDLKLPLEHLDQLVLDYLKGNNETMDGSESTNSSLNKSNFGSMISPKSTNEGKNSIENTLSSDTYVTDGSNSNTNIAVLTSSNATTSTTDITTHIDDEPPVLSPQPQIIPPSYSKKFYRSNSKNGTFWDVSRKIRFLNALEKETMNFKEQKQSDEKISWRELFKSVNVNHPEFQLVNRHAMHYRFRLIQNESKAMGAVGGSKMQEILKRFMPFVGAHSSIRKSTIKRLPSKPTRRIIKKAKKITPPRRSYTYQEQLLLIRKMTEEWKRMEKSSADAAKSPWRYILERLAKQNYLNMPFSKLVTLWAKISVSAKVHAKDGDIVDSEAWELLQAYKKYQVLKSKSRNQKNDDEPSTSKTDDVNDSTSYPIKASEKVDEADNVEEDKGSDNDWVPSDKDVAGDFDEDDRFDETTDKVQVKIESGTLEFDRLKFVKAVKREFIDMCERKETNLRNPFLRIFKRLAHKEYSQFTPHDLQTKWRGMRSRASVHQKNGNLTVLDRAIVDLINYKKTRESYEKADDGKSSSNDASEESAALNSDGNQEDDESKSEDDEDGKSSSKKKCLLQISFLEALEERIRIMSLAHVKDDVDPIKGVISRLIAEGYSKHSYGKLFSLWHRCCSRARQNRKMSRKLTKADRIVFSTLHHRRQIMAALDEVKLCRDIVREFEIVQKDRSIVHPLHVVLTKLVKEKYRQYEVADLRDLWKKIRGRAKYRTKRGLVLPEAERLNFSIMQNKESFLASEKRSLGKSNEECTKRSLGVKKNEPDKSQPSTSKGESDKSQPSTSKGESNKAQSSTSKDESNKSHPSTSKDERAKSQPSTSKVDRKKLCVSKEWTGSKPGRKRKWAEDDLMVLFKLIKHEYYDLLKSKNPVPSQPWLTIIRRIAEKKLFKKCSDERKLYRMWLSMRTRFSTHENTRNMTQLDWKVARLLKKVNEMKGIKVNRSDADVPKQRPRPKLVEDNDDSNDAEKRAANDNANSASTEQISTKLKLDLIDIMRKFGKEAFIRTDRRPKNSHWPSIEMELRKLGHTMERLKIQSNWHYMVSRAKLAMADQRQPNEVEQKVIELMEEVIRKKNDKLVEESDREECTREDLKVEPISEDDYENEGDDEESMSSREVEMDYKHISLKDIEAKEKDPSTSLKIDALNIKNSPPNPFSDDSSDATIGDYFEENAPKDTPLRKVVVKQEPVQHNATNNDQPKSDERLETLENIIDLCSDIELDDLLPDVNDGTEFIQNL